VVAVAASGVLILWRLGNQRWFSNDEWDFLSTRHLTDVGDLFRPHNEHWTTLPIVAFRLVWSVNGLRSYWPYQVLSVGAHLSAVVLLRVVMRRAGVRPWFATVAAGSLLLFGPGAQDIVEAFQITFVGAFAFGPVQLVLADHDGPVDRNDWLGLAAGAAALLCSGIGLTMALTVGVAVLIRRGWRLALFHTVPLGAMYGVWWLIERPPAGHNPLGASVTYIAGSLNCPTPVYDGPNVTQNGQQWTVDLQCDLEASPQVADAFMNMVVSANHLFGPDSGASSPEALNFFLGLKVEFSIGGLVFSTDLFVGQGNSSRGGNDWWIGGTVLGCDGSQALIAFSEPDEAVLQVLAVDTSASGAFVLDPYWTSLQPLPDQSAWMAGLDPTLSIGAINLPGSHDSAAIGGWTRFWTTQSLSLTDQFNAGVRLFDIRVAVRQPEPDGPYVFYTCHGDAGAEIDANLFQTLESALDELQAVLQPEGTQEFIVMSLKIDDDGGFSPYEFVADLETLLTGIDNLLCSPSLPTVGQAQGKIYVVNRVRDLNLAAADLAIPDNTPGDLLTASSDHRFSVYVQDQYEDYDGNPVTVKLGLYQDAVQAGTAADVLLNFASGTTCVVFGVYIDQFILQWLGASPAATRPARLGWTLHDFVDAAYGTDKYGAMSLIQIVVASNFGYAAYPETFNPFAPGAVLPTAPSRALRRAFRARRAALRAEAASSSVPARAPENTPA